MNILHILAVVLFISVSGIAGAETDNRVVFVEKLKAKTKLPPRGSDSGRNQGRDSTEETYATVPNSFSTLGGGCVVNIGVVHVPERGARRTPREIEVFVAGDVVNQC